jgi:hypothetical protein
VRDGLLLVLRRKLPRLLKPCGTRARSCMGRAPFFLEGFTN